MIDIKKIDRLYSMQVCPSCKTRINFFKGYNYDYHDGCYYKLVTCKCGLQKDLTRMPTGWHPELLDKVIEETDQADIETEPIDYGLEVIDLW